MFVNLEYEIEQVEKALFSLKEKMTLSKWIEPESAGVLLGFRITKSRGYTRKLKELRDNGKITKFRPGSPYLYDREEIHELAKSLKKRSVRH